MSLRLFSHQNPFLPTYITDLDIYTLFVHEIFVYVVNYLRTKQGMEWSSEGLSKKSMRGCRQEPSEICFVLSTPLNRSQKESRLRKITHFQIKDWEMKPKSSGNAKFCKGMVESNEETKIQKKSRDLR